MERRTFVKNTAFAAAALGVGPLQPLAFTGNNKVRLVLIGTGLRGQAHLENVLRRDDTEVIAICDIDERMLDMTAGIIKKSGKKMPQVFKGDPYAYRKMLELKNIDAVLIVTPWEWHTPMIVDVLQAGIKYIATEVVLGITTDDHWKVVREVERQKAQVMMLENACYFRDVLAVLNMVRKNIFGEIIHLQAGYQHDLRGVKFNNGIDPYDSGAEFGEKGFSEARWRTNHSVHRNGDLYPTHGIGPIATMININHGNRFLSLNAFASKARGLHEYIVSKGGAGHSNTKVQFKLGDVVTTQIKCANGETILLQHDTNLPRPYSLGFRVQGTKGLWMQVNHGIYVEGQSAKKHEWDDEKIWLEKYDHPLWKRWGTEDNEKAAGHGGIDFFVLHAFIEAVKRGAPTPLDVYDAAAWSVITPLSEQSIELGNETVEFPDFTNGQWMYRKPKFCLNDEY
ncbi:MAG: Gfo/Idh/MocA family oxidoreductase [Chitinophagaceae bacterium]|nr:Gfo/Idh/MocA family oxidoreductase [Chitinophagaceae bacterium]MCW5928063.1 Gfo/Idh/MocA family oxidoreductase [Chitinophagaceae bacterium]